MTLDALRLDEVTRELLAAYCRSPKHALLLHGIVGSGLGTTAHAVAELLTDHATAITDVIPDEKGTITIEQVRTLYVRTRDKQVARQVVIVDDIDTMSFEAQNAFLKLLEEPNEYTYFIVTTHALEALLPTISSRTQRIDVRPVSSETSKNLLRTLGVSDATEQQQMLFLANGLAAELSRLATRPDYFGVQAEVVRSARALLSEPLHERLVRIAQFSDRAAAQRLVAVLGALVVFMLERTPSEPKLLLAANAVETASERLAMNGHVRTQLMHLVSQLA